MLPRGPSSYSEDSSRARTHCLTFCSRCVPASWCIQPDNVLLTERNEVKLCDFGMAKRMPNTVVLPSGGTEVVRLAFTMCGTPEFMAPEFVLSTGYDKGVDWWALGCIAVEMYSGRAPFDYDGDLKKTFKAVCLIGMGRKTLDVPKALNKKGMEHAAGERAK